jgi:hypothetical protein
MILSASGLNVLEEEFSVFLYQPPLPPTQIYHSKLSLDGDSG